MRKTLLLIGFATSSPAFAQAVSCQTKLNACSEARDVSVQMVNNKTRLIENLLGKNAKLTLNAQKSEERALSLENAQSAWYRNPWLWLSVGVALGGVVVHYVDRSASR